MIRTETDEKGVEFEIDDNGTLISVKLNGGNEVVIPYKTNGGLTIDRVVSGVFKKYSEEDFGESAKDPLRIILGEGITYVGAFMLNGVKTRPIDFVWNNTCDTIPSQFFYKINLVGLSGIENVQQIGSEAFCKCQIKSINWPRGCTEIPMSCFMNSELTSISGIEHVKSVEEGAFLGCESLEGEFKWPEKAKKVPNKCFDGCRVSKISGLKKVNEIGSYAFASSGLTEIDLSGTSIKKIGYGAFEETHQLKTVKWSPKCEVIPYYCFCASHAAEIKNLFAVKEIGDLAFWRSEIKQLDFSESQLLSIGKKALPSDNVKIIPPYYSSILEQEDIYFD